MKLPDRGLSQSPNSIIERMNKRAEGINKWVEIELQVRQVCNRVSPWGSPPWGFMPDICQKFFLAKGKNLWKELGKPMSSYKNCPATIFCNDVIKIIDKYKGCEVKGQNEDWWALHNEGYKVEKSGGKFTILHNEHSTHLSQVTSVSSSPTKAMLPDKSASIKAGKISIEPVDIESDGSWDVLLPSDAIQPVYEKPVLAVPSETTTLSATSSSATTVLLPTTSSTAATTPGLTATIPTTSTSEPSTSTTPLRITTKTPSRSSTKSKKNPLPEEDPATEEQKPENSTAIRQDLPKIEDLAQKTSTQNYLISAAIVIPNMMSTLIGAVTSVLPKSTTPGIGYSKVLGLTSAEVTTPGFATNGTANEGAGNDIEYPKDHPIFGLRLPGNGSDITVGGVLNHTIDEFRKIITQDNSNKPLSPAQLSWIIAAFVGGALLLISGGIIYKYCCKPAGGKYQVKQVVSEHSLPIGNEAPGADLLDEVNEV